MTTELHTLNRAQLTEIYNSHLATLVKMKKDETRKPVKSFKDHTTALARATAIVEEVTKLRDAEHKAAPKSDRTWAGISITEDYQPVADMNRMPRANSLRSIVHSLLVNGAKWDAIHAAINEAKPNGNPTTLPIRAYRLVLDMWYQFGYGIKQDQTTGVIRIYR